MKKLFLTIVCSVAIWSVTAQDYQAAMRTDIKPYKAEVSFNKTLHILFPAEVKYVDLGSSDLIADKADGAGNVVRIKAANEFTGETNFSIITADGVFYTFDAVYSDNPRTLTIEIADWLHDDPYSKAAERLMYVRPEEFGNRQTPLQVSRTMYSIYLNNKIHIRTIENRNGGIKFKLLGIYVGGDMLYLMTSIENDSSLDFEIDRIRFRICERKVSKRTARQETVLNPIRIFDENTSLVKAGETLRNVYVFRRFTMPKTQALRIELFEAGGARHLSFEIRHFDVEKALKVDDMGR